MTMIAVAAHANYAEICTDSFTMTNWGRRTGMISKTQPMPHLDAALAVQGDQTFFASLNAHIAATDRSEDFDQLLHNVRSLLPSVWESRWAGATPYDSTAYLVGLSAEHGRFKAYAFPSTHDFAPVDLGDALFLFPAPYTPAPGRPANAAEWVDLAKRAHRERSLDIFDTGRKVPTGGRVILTHIEAGAISQRTIHAFDDPAEFRQMMQGFLHPSSQLGRCHCGSGQIFARCCLAGAEEEPCRCGSGRTFGSCCRVDPDTAPSDPCPCGAPAAFAECCRVEPDEAHNATSLAMAVSA